MKKGIAASPIESRAQAGLVLTMVFWGSAYVTSKMIVRDVTPDVAAVLRFGFGATVMMALLFARESRPVPPRNAWPTLLLLTAFGVVGYNACFFRGLQTAPASDAAMIVPTLSPLLAALAGMAFLGEPVRFLRLAGLGVALAGAALFFGEALMPGRDPARLTGDLYLSGAGACWAVASLLSRRLLGRVGPLHAAAWSLLLGSAALLVVSVPELAAVRWEGLPHAFWWVLAYLVVFPTVIAYIFWMEGIRVLGAGPATVFMFLSPLFGLLMSVLLLGERMTSLQALGGAIMLSGVWLVHRPARNAAL